MPRKLTLSPLNPPLLFASHEDNPSNARLYAYGTSPLAVGARRRPWVVGIRPSLFTGCGGCGERWPSLVEGGGGGGLLLSPVVRVLRLVRHRRVGCSSFVVSVHGISMLSSHRRCPVRLSRFVVDPLSCFSPSC